MQILRRLFALFLCSAVAAWAQGNSFDKVRYNGGSVGSRVAPKDWHKQLTVTPDLITLALKDGKKVEIPPKSVSGHADWSKQITVQSGSEAQLTANLEKQSPQLFE